MAYLLSREELVTVYLLIMEKHGQPLGKLECMVGLLLHIVMEHLLLREVKVIVCLLIKVQLGLLQPYLQILLEINYLFQKSVPYHR